MLPGANAEVTIEHLSQTKDPHGSKVDGAPIPEDTVGPVEAMVVQISHEDFYRITVGADVSAITKAPREWRITDSHGRVFNCAKATYRPPIERLGESAHTLVFADLVGQIER